MPRKRAAKTMPAASAPATERTKEKDLARVHSGDINLTDKSYGALMPQLITFIKNEAIIGHFKTVGYVEVPLVSTQYTSGVSSRGDDGAGIRTIGMVTGKKIYARNSDGELRHLGDVRLDFDPNDSTKHVHFNVEWAPVKDSRKPANPPYFIGVNQLGKMDVSPVDHSEVKADEKTDHSAVEAQVRLAYYRLTKEFVKNLCDETVDLPYAPTDVVDSKHIVPFFNNLQQVANGAITDADLLKVLRAKTPKDDPESEDVIRKAGKKSLPARVYVDQMHAKKVMREFQKVADAYQGFFVPAPEADLPAAAPTPGLAAPMAAYHMAGADGLAGAGAGAGAAYP